MSLEKNKTILRRFVEELNKRNLSIMDELMAPAMVHHTIPMRGPEEYKQFETAPWKAFPDWHKTIQDMIAEGDQVWCLEEITATHTGELCSFLPQINKKVRVAPAGKKITFAMIGIFRIVDGKIVDRRSVHAIMEAYKDLGIIECKELPEDAR